MFFLFFPPQQRVFFIPYFVPVFFFLVRAYQIIFNWSSERGHSWFIPDFRKKDFDFLFLSIMFVVSLSKFFLCLLRPLSYYYKSYIINEMITLTLKISLFVPNYNFFAKVHTFFLILGTPGLITFWFSIILFSFYLCLSLNMSHESKTSLLVFQFLPMLQVFSVWLCY